MPFEPISNCLSSGPYSISGLLDFWTTVLDPTRLLDYYSGPYSTSGLLFWTLLDFWTTILDPTRKIDGEGTSRPGPNMLAHISAYFCETVHYGILSNKGNIGMKPAYNSE